MTFNISGRRLFVKVIVLLAAMVLASHWIAQQKWSYTFFCAVVIIYLVADLLSFLNSTNRELANFAEAIRYRDFSRNFDISRASADVRSLRKSFNDITNTFKSISKDKETQYQYLQKILELVNTGILSFRQADGEVMWMNETLKKLLNLPYLKTVHSLARRDEELYHHLVALQPGETRIATIQSDKKALKVLLSATAFLTYDERFMLIAFQNVNEALDETESKAWQRLLSVMTHEIMNSIAPISSLADTLRNRLHYAIDNPGDNDGLVEDLKLGIDTIKKRSEGLLKFAETYRNLNKITTPNVSAILVRDLFENLYTLMEPTLIKKDIELDIVLKETSLLLEADTTLVEQVLINLLVNAIDAVRDQPEPLITLQAEAGTDKKIVIKVSDNGAGMSHEVLNNIFIPFFTTKKNGSGIGLSLCKQIMMLHHGNIHVQSTEGAGTTFLLQF